MFLCPLSLSRKAMLDDIAVLTKGELISEELGVKLERVTLDMLGTCKKVRMDKPREQRPRNSCVLVGKRDRRDIGMAPLSQLLEPPASRILLGPNSAEDSASSMNEQGAQIAVPSFADAEQPCTSSARLLLWH